MINSIYEFFDIQYAIPIVLEEYGHEPKEYEIIDMGVKLLKQIGNYHTDRHLFIGEVVDNKLELPCNVTTIESVTLNTFNLFRNNIYFNYVFDFYNLRGLEVSRRFDGFTSNGQFLNYRFVKENGNSWLEFNQLATSSNKDVQNKIDEENLYKDKYVYVIYSGQLLDERGYPKVTNQEAIAIAYWYMLVDYKKKTILSLNNGQMIPMFKEQYEKAVSKARNIVSLNQNLADALLDNKFGNNMKQYGKSFKYKN
jgi:hypothetical protein